jgi:hypothetical protein
MDETQNPLHPKFKLTPITRPRLMARPSQIQVLKDAESDLSPLKMKRVLTPVSLTFSAPTATRRLEVETLVQDPQGHSHKRKLTSLEELGQFFLAAGLLQEMGARPDSPSSMTVELDVPSGPQSPERLPSPKP